MIIRYLRPEGKYLSVVAVAHFFPRAHDIPVLSGLGIRVWDLVILRGGALGLQFSGFMS